MNKTLTQWLEYIESLHPQHIELTLERVASVAERLSLLNPAPQVITVGGTNGKGSCVATIEALAVELGMTVAAYTSPHLIRFNERLRINQQMLDDVAWSEAFSMVEAARDGIALTYFEFTTLAALILAKQAKVELLVLEVGLGGRLDAVNIIDNQIAIITSIGFDHEDWLGNSLEAIAKEKSGIIRAKQTALLANHNLVDLIRPYLAKGTQVQVSSVPDDWRDLLNEYAATLYPDSVAAGVTALQAMGKALSREQFERGLANAVIPGRWQSLNYAKPFWVDVAHNPQAVANLASKIQQTGLTRWVFITAMLKDKKAADALAHLNGIDAHWICVPTTGVRGMSAQMLAQQCPDQAGKPACAESLTDALAQVEQLSSPPEGILVFGSFHIVAEMIKYSS